jgi:hypothetical protein
MPQTHAVAASCVLQLQKFDTPNAQFLSEDIVFVCHVMMPGDLYWHNTSPETEAAKNKEREER